MTDAEKCRLIAEFEGENWNDYAEQRIDAAMDYPHDLNATMRAARRLPPDWVLYVQSDGYARITYMADNTQFNDTLAQDDPARAAFEALVAWLMERGK